MSDQSRRRFLKATSVGGAAVGGAIFMPRLFDQAARADAPAPRPAPRAAEAVHTGPFVAYVKNAKTGQIAVLTGEREVLHHDPQLAASLARVAAGLPQA
jgi:hypothetical protein